MRAACLVLVAGSLAPAGCSALIVSSGVDPSHLKTREDVRAAFGTPVHSGDTECEPFDEFKTRRKIADKWKTIYLAVGYVMTAGFGAFVYFPQQAFVAARLSVVGQHVVITYDAEGNVTSMKRDGEWEFWCGRVGRPESIKP